MTTNPSFTIPAPDTKDPEDRGTHIQAFTLTAVREIRSANAATNTTRAWELTFNIPSGLAVAHMGNTPIAGAQIALLPVNDDASVSQVLQHVNRVPNSPSPYDVPLQSAGGKKRQLLSAEQRVAHTIDLTRPTPQLYDLVAFARQTGDIWKQPVGDFLEILRIRGDQHPLYQVINSSLRQGEKNTPLHEVLHKLAKQEKLSFQEHIPLFEALGMEVEKASDIPVADFLAEHSGEITYEQLLARQPALANRKYTPSAFDRDRSTISIMFSEVEHGAHMGTMSKQLHQMANHFLQTGEPQTVQGFLDLRKHKLPYHAAEAENLPLIMISTGVGIAPHISYLRDAQARGHAPNVALMLSGGRQPADELMGEEIRDVIGDAYQYVSSRTDKKYVQDILRDQEKTLWHELEQGAHIFVCGLESMEQGIREALGDIAKKHGIEDPEAWLNERLHTSTSGPDRFYGDKWEAEWQKRQQAQSPPRG